MVNDPHQATIAIHHIDMAMDALHKMNWAGSQLPVNRAWDDLIDAKHKIEEMCNALKKSQTEVD